MEYKVRIGWYGNSIGSKVWHSEFSILFHFFNNWLEINKNIQWNNFFQSSRERSSTPSSIGGSVSTQSSKFRRGSESTTNHIARNSSPPIAESEESESETNKNVVENFKSENTRTEFEPYDDNNIIGASSAAVSKSSKNKPENREDDIYFPFKKSYPKPTSENPEIDVSELVYASREILKVYGM